jgi:type I restriction enzyme S subunit
MKRISGDYLAPYLRNVNVQWDRVSINELPTMDFEPHERPRYRLHSGDLLVCEGGEVGRTAMWRGELDECYYQKAIHRLRPRRRGEHNRFFYYVMHAAAKRGVFVAMGNPNTIDHLTADQLSHFRFAFPPASEQVRIAEALDDETRRVDSLVTKVGAAIALLREYRTALISAAVTGQIEVREGKNRSSSD